jgi:hypothetical protein
MIKSKVSRDRIRTVALEKAGFIDLFRTNNKSTEITTTIIAIKVPNAGLKSIPQKYQSNEMSDAGNIHPERLNE